MRRWPGWTPRAGDNLDAELADELFRKALLHIEKHGSIDEAELTSLVGGPRRARVFARDLDTWRATLPFDIEERQRRQVVLDEGDVGGEPRHALVDVLERLQVRQMDHREERLLEWIGDRGSLREQQVEQLLEPLRDRQRQVHGTADRHLDLANAADCFGIGEQALGEQRVQVADRVAVEVDLLSSAAEQRPVYSCSVTFTL